MNHIEFDAIDSMRPAQKRDWHQQQVIQRNRRRGLALGEPEKLWVGATVLSQTETECSIQPIVVVVRPKYCRVAFPSYWDLTT